MNKEVFTRIIPRNYNYFPAEGTGSGTVFFDALTHPLNFTNDSFIVLIRGWTFFEHHSFTLLGPGLDSSDRGARTRYKGFNSSGGLGPSVYTGLNAFADHFLMAH